MRPIGRVRCQSGTPTAPSRCGSRSGLLGFLVLNSASPRSGRTVETLGCLRTKATTDGPSGGDQVTATSFRTLIPRIKLFFRRTAGPGRGANSEANRDKLGRSASLCSDRNPSRCWIKKTRVSPTDGRVLFPRSAFELRPQSTEWTEKTPRVFGSTLRLLGLRGLRALWRFR